MGAGELCIYLSKMYPLYGHSGAKWSRSGIITLCTTTQNTAWACLLPASGSFSPNGSPSKLLQGSVSVQNSSWPPLSKYSFRPTPQLSGFVCLFLLLISYHPVPPLPQHAQFSLDYVRFPLLGPRFFFFKGYTSSFVHTW